MMKAGASRRRTKAEIVDQKIAKAKRKKEIDDRLAELDTLKREMVDLKQKAA